MLCGQIVFSLIIFWKCCFSQDTVPPILTCPGEVRTSTTSSQATATWTVIVTDNVDSGLTATCVPQSGSTFSIGTHSVTCSATDTASNSNSCTFNVYSIADNEPPDIECPSDINTAMASSQATVRWNDPVVVDNIDSGLLPTCLPSPGTQFDVGSTSVTCSATDVAGNNAICTFRVTVVDNGIPEMQCSEDLYIGLARTYYASVVWDYPIVTDNVDSSLSSSCTKYSSTGLYPTTSPDTFALGSYTITCTSTDSAGNTGSCIFQIIVVEDHVNPTLSCPSNITSSQSEVTWDDLVVHDNIDIGLPSSCRPSSGSIFGIGSTDVYCYSTDAAGNLGSCTFRVNVVENISPEEGNNGITSPKGNEPPEAHTGMSPTEGNTSQGDDTSLDGDSDKPSTNLYLVLLIVSCGVLLMTLLAFICFCRFHFSEKKQTTGNNRPLDLARLNNSEARPNSNDRYSGGYETAIPDMISTHVPFNVRDTLASEDRHTYISVEE